MARLLVVTDSETATGFRLAGCEVLETNASAVQKQLDEIISSERYGLVIVDQGLIADPNKATERAMRGRALPVILPMPSLGTAFDEGSDDSVEYMKQLVRSAIGFDIKLE